MRKGVIIFSGYNQRAVIAFLRTLESRSVQYAIVASSDSDPIFESVYADRVTSTREIKELNLDDLLHHISKARETRNWESALIAPSTEALNRFLLDNQGAFEDAGCIVPLPTKDLYEQVSDKASFSNICRQEGIDVPGEYQTLEQVELPFVAKPRTYVSADGKTHTPVIIKTDEDKAKFTAEYSREDFYFQQYVDGASYYLLYYIDKEGVQTTLSQKNLIQQPDGKSIIAATVSNVHESEAAKPYSELLRQLQYRGLIMIEVKQQDGKFIMIEANPRFWGPSQLFVDAGVNLFDNFLHDWGLITDIPAKAHIQADAKYYWYGGFVQAQRSGGQVSYHEYDSDRYAAESKEWLAVDVYNREDTIGIFNSEAGI